jgi:hypothetical protein
VSDQDQDKGQQPLTAGTSNDNAIDFTIQQALGFVRTATIVQVKAVYATKDDAENNSPVKQAGDVAPVGFVDVLPLVNLIDGVGTATEHVTVYGLPYFRLQGGKNAIICDPEVDDIGIAVISDRDISSVKANKAQANPGSFRRFSLADGIYLGGILNDTPNQYVRFRPDGLEVVDKNGNSVVMSPDGIVVTDVNKNVITTNSTGISAVDLSNNTLTTSPTGVVLTDISTNTITTDPTGIVLVDVTKNSILMQPGGVSIINADGSKAVMVGDVLDIQDNSGNSIVSTTSGMTLTDTNGNKIDMKSGSIAITGNLTVTGTITEGFGGADQVGVSTHIHGGVTGGAGNTAPPTAGT